MQFMEKVVGLIATNLIWFTVLLIYGKVCGFIFPALQDAANTSGIYSQVHPLYQNIQLYGWIALMVFGIGSLAYILLSAHQDENEPYYRDYNPPMQRY